MRVLSVGEARERCGVERLGFMGVTHALSAVTVAGVAIGLFPRVVTGLWDAPTLALLVGFVASVAGWSMVPDLDNTSARAISDLGPVGRVLSFLFRESSSFVQGVTSVCWRAGDGRLGVAGRECGCWFCNGVGRECWRWRACCVVVCWREFSFGGFFSVQACC